MSAPQTNIETQSRWHRAPLIGLIAVVVFALGLLFWQMLMVADGGTPVDSGADQIDGRTGGTIPAEDPPATPDGDLPPPELPSPAPDTPVSPVTPPQAVAP